MPLSTKTFYSIVEAAARWGRGIPDIINWAAGGKLRIVTLVGYAQSDAGPIFGRFEICADDMMAHFRNDGPAQRELRVYRVRITDSAGTPTDWMFIQDVDGKPGIPISQHDIYIIGEEFMRFQEEHELGVIIKEKIIYRVPAADRHDWEAMYRKLCKRIFDSGLPEHLLELANEMQEWFIMQSSDGEAPDLSTIRKRLQPIWNDLRDAG